MDGWVNTIFPQTEDFGTYEFLDDYKDTGVQNINMHLGGYYIVNNNL